jgi:hypothetical protein
VRSNLKNRYRDRSEEQQHQQTDTGHCLNDRFGFFRGEDGRQIARWSPTDQRSSASAEGINAIVELDLEHLAVQKEQGAEGLILSGGGNVLDCT